MTVPPITEIEAVETLQEMLKIHDTALPRLRGETRRVYQRRAEAIRWALSLTAFPVDAPEVPNG